MSLHRDIVIFDSRKDSLSWRIQRRVIKTFQLKHFETIRNEIKHKHSSHLVSSFGEYKLTHGFISDRPNMATTLWYEPATNILSDEVHQAISHIKLFTKSTHKNQRRTWWHEPNHTNRTESHGRKNCPKYHYDEIKRNDTISETTHTRNDLKKKEKRATRWQQTHKSKKNLAHDGAEKKRESNTIIIRWQWTNIKETKRATRWRQTNRQIRKRGCLTSEQRTNTCHKHVNQKNNPKSWLAPKITE